MRTNYFLSHEKTKTLCFELNIFKVSKNNSRSFSDTSHTDVPSGDTVTDVPKV